MTVQYARQIFMYSWDCARRRDSKRSGQVQETVESVPFIFSFFSSLSFSREILEDPSLIVSLRSEGYLRRNRRNCPSNLKFTKYDIHGEITQFQFTRFLKIVRMKKNQNHERRGED